MKKHLIASYSNLLGKPEVNTKSAIQVSNRVRIIRNGEVLSQKCAYCSKLQVKIGVGISKQTFKPNGVISHTKGCKLNG